MDALREITEWESISRDGVYWFALRRNSLYREDLQRFEDELVPMYAHYGCEVQNGCCGPIIRKADTDGRPFLVSPLPIDSPEKKDHLTLMNESYIAFVAKWRIPPWRVGLQSPTPQILSKPLKFSSTEVIFIGGQIQLSTDTYSVLRGFEEEMEALGTLSRSAPDCEFLDDNISFRQSSNLENIKKAFRLLEIWEQSSLGGLSVISPFVDYESSTLGAARMDRSVVRYLAKKVDDTPELGPIVWAAKSIWPEDIALRFKEIFGSTTEFSHSNLSKRLRFARLVISFPLQILDAHTT